MDALNSGLYEKVESKEIPNIQSIESYNRAYAQTEATIHHFLANPERQQYANDLDEILQLTPILAEDPANIDKATELLRTLHVALETQQEYENIIGNTKAELQNMKTSMTGFQFPEAENRENETQKNFLQMNKEELIKEYEDTLKAAENGGFNLGIIIKKILLQIVMGIRGIKTPDIETIQAKEAAEKQKIEQEEQAEEERITKEQEKQQQEEAERVKQEEAEAEAEKARKEQEKIAEEQEIKKNKDFTKIMGTFVSKQNNFSTMYIRNHFHKMEGYFEELGKQDIQTIKGKLEKISGWFANIDRTKIEPATLDLIARNTILKDAIFSSEPQENFRDFILGLPNKTIKKITKT